MLRARKVRVCQEPGTLFIPSRIAYKSSLSFRRANIQTSHCFVSGSGAQIFNGENYAVVVSSSYVCLVWGQFWPQRYVPLTSRYQSCESLVNSVLSLVVRGQGAGASGIALKQLRTDLSLYLPCNHGASSGRCSPLWLLKTFFTWTLES